MSNYKGPYNSFSQNAEPTYNQNNILGTVSQSGGVPTGAIIERGSNANGEFVKYADGTQICTAFKKTLAMSSSQFLQGSFSFPANFASQPFNTVVFETGLSLFSQSADNSYSTSDLGQSALYCRSDSNFQWQNVRVHNGDAVFSSGDTVKVDLIAIGRWY